MKESAPDLQDGSLTILTISSLIINQRIGSRSAGWIYIQFDHFLIKSQLMNGLGSAGWIYIKFDHFQISGGHQGGSN